MSITDALQNIRSYTNRHTELREAEYFIFDRHLFDSKGPPDALLLGINPKESGDFVPGHSVCQEISSEHDFRKGLPQRRATNNWLKNVQEMLGGDNVTTSEFFFWASANTGEAFYKRFHYPFTNNPHLRFCMRMNNVLISEYGIRRIVCPGLVNTKIAKDNYELKHEKTVRCPVTSHRLIEHFSDVRSDWIFTKHWTGARGFSLTQKQLIKSYLREN